MSSVKIPATDPLFLQWIENFAAVATANATALGFTTGQTTNMTALATAFATAYEESQAIKVTAKSKTAAKDTMREASEGLFRGFAKMVNSNFNVSNELKAELGITVTPVSPSPVQVPVDLTVVGISTGVNKLAWKSNGNRPSVSYIIECKLPDQVVWSFAAVSSTLKYQHTGQLPGQQISYRVSAQRAGVQSVPCPPVVAYSDLESETVFLSQAA